MATFVNTAEPFVFLGDSKTHLSESGAKNEDSASRGKTEEFGMRNFSENRDPNSESRSKRTVSAGCRLFTPTSGWFKVVMGLLLVIVTLVAFQLFSMRGSLPAHSETNMTKFFEELLVQLRKDRSEYRGFDAAAFSSDLEKVRAELTPGHKDGDREEGVADKRITDTGDNLEKLLSSVAILMDRHVINVESILRQFLKSFDQNVKSLRDDVDLRFEKKNNSSLGLLKNYLNVFANQSSRSSNEKISMDKAEDYLAKILGQLEKSNVDNALLMTDFVSSFQNATKALRMIAAQRSSVRPSTTDISREQMDKWIGNVSLGFNDFLRFLKEVETNDGDSSSQNSNNNNHILQLRTLLNITISMAKAMEALSARESFHDYRNPKFSCPDRLYHDYTHVGPGGHWSKCYMIPKAVDKMNKSNAQKFCKRIKGRLVTFESKLEFDYLKTIVSADKRPFWLGAKRPTDRDGRWYWEESPLADRHVEVDFWDLRDESFAHSCAVLNSLWKMETRPCESLMFPVCETKSKNSDWNPVEADEIRFGTEICDRNGSSCYRASLNASVWSVAQDKCNQLGGHLVHINSLEESNELQKLNLDEFWIGGRLLTENEWKWIGINTTNSMQFTDWRESKSDVYSGTQRCLKYWSHTESPRKWKIEKCSSWKKFVCEFNYNNITTNTFFTSPLCINLRNVVHDTRVRISKVTKCFSFVQSQMLKNDASKFCREKFNASLAKLDEMLKNKTVFSVESKRIRSGATWLTQTAVVPATPLETDALRFDGASRTAGKIEGKLKINGYRLCGSGWDENDAKVACRQLGLPFLSVHMQYFSIYSAISYKTSSYGCSGNENSLAECPFSVGSIRSRINYCVGQRLAGATCSTTINANGFRETNGNWEFVNEDGVEDWGWFVCQMKDVEKVTIV